ncbi:TetR/AcrR family transcriptional regulator [Deinococcus sp.]|uniref:TetR/AcrR family transcriptional regulator n=1 Tax=Deinococcus sp. TaxID=47478 RepID=UPI003B59AA7D
MTSLSNETMNADQSAASCPDGSPQQRADAQRNREHLLISAAATFTAQGPRVSMQRIAQEAGVGIGTLYRHFPDRTALLAALGHRAYQAVLQLAQASRAAESDPFLALRRFLLGTLDHREVLVLPLHGAPVTASPADMALRRAISAELEQILQVGQQSGTLRRDVNATDVIVFGAMLAQTLPNFPNPERAAERVAQIFIDGLRVSASALPGQPVSRAEMERTFADSQKAGLD